MPFAASQTKPDQKFGRPADGQDCRTHGELEGRRVEPSKREESITSVAIEAARRRFSPEFMNRVDKIVVFKSLEREHLERSWISSCVLSRNSSGARKLRSVLSAQLQREAFSIREGTDRRYGARPLKTAIEHYITFPLANLVASSQIEGGDTVTVDIVDGSWKFTVGCSCESCQCGNSAKCCCGSGECTASKAEKEVIN